MAILITGAAGFIGSCLVSFLNEKGLTDLILVDDFNIPAKTRNLDGKKFTAKIDRNIFLNDIKRHKIKHHDPSNPPSARDRISIDPIIFYTRWSE